ncbi:Ger(x)C family spore germination protein [Neobacillus sp. SAB-20_R2A]|uniref:Ger(x)C family spore germination protein n=1 Tax=Neobacillus sp. SAB-20_R2A TaxID=3120519 RepID=UPI003C6E6672
MKKARILLLILFLLIPLTGCWDRTEINDLAFVVATGVDKGPKQQYRFTVQVPLPSSLGGTGSSGGGGGTSGEGPFLIATGTGRNIREGVEDIQARLSRELYFAHRRVLVIGEDQAKEGIREILNAVFTQPQSRLSTFLIVSKGEAVKMLKAQPRMELSSAEAMREMAKAGANLTVMDVLQNLDRQGKSLIIPMVEPTGTLKKESDGKEVLMDSFAVFKADKLSFFTSKRESHGILWLLERMKKKSYSFSVSKNKEMTVHINENSVRPNLKIVNGKPEFTVSVRITGHLVENEANLRIEDPATYNKIIDNMEEKIKNDIHSILKRAHTQGIDIYGFGWFLFKRHHQKWEHEWKQNWKSMLPSLKVTVKVDADIQRTTNTGNVERN